MIYIEKFVSELITGMERLEEYAEEESPYTEQDNLQRELKSEMEFVKKENERILRAQKELNHILIEIFHTGGKGKRDDSEAISYQHKYTKTKQIKNKSSSSSKVYGDQHNSHYTSDSSEDNHHTRKR